MAEKDSDKTRTNEILGIDLEIVEILWLHMNSVGLSRGEIAKALRKRGIERKDGAIKIHIRHLRLRSPRLIKVTIGAHGRELYRIERDETITWPSTARTLLELWNYPGQAAKRGPFVQHILKLQFNDMTTGTPLDADSLNDQIDFSLKWGYLTYINVDRLIPARRLEEEYEFMKFIAGQCLPSQGQSTS